MSLLAQVNDLPISPTTLFWLVVLAAFVALAFFSTIILLKANYKRCSSNQVLVIFGRNAWTIIMMGFFAALPPVILKTIEGMSNTRKVLVNVGRSFNLTPAQQFWKIMFPAALPTIFVGVRLGLIVAMINIVAMEYLINVGGLGELINELAEQYDLAGTYAATLFVVLVSSGVFVLTEGAERWLAKAT